MSSFASRCLACLVAVSSLAPRAAADNVPVARVAPDGQLELLELDAQGLPLQLVAQGADLLPLELVGAPRRDRLLLQVPRPSRPDDPLTHVTLPSGGALYRVALAQGQALLHAGADGSLELLAAAPELLPQAAVASDGSRVLLATPPSHGGDLLSVDLATGASINLTASLPAQEVEPASLRISAEGAFWVTAGVLWRAPAGSAPKPVGLGLPGLPVLPDLALSADGRRAAVVAGSEDKQLADRHVAVVDLAGGVKVVTSGPGDWDTPGTDHPLGPFVALSADGSRVVWRGTVQTQELFLAEVDLPTAGPKQLSVEPQFPAYIDNAGVLGFKPDGRLSFFAGDVTISGVDQQEMIGAADLYLAEVPVAGTPTFVNMSVTSGQVSPPYEQPGQLLFSEVVLDPQARRWLLLGESPEGDQTLTAVSALEGDYTQAVKPLLGGLDFDPLLLGAGIAVLVVSEVEVEGGAAEQEWQRIDLLPALHGAPQGDLLHLADLPAPLRADRFTALPFGGWAACVVSAGEGLELPVLLDVATGLPSLPLSVPWGVAPRMAFDPLGRLVLGFGAGDGPYKLLALDPAGGGQALKLPAGEALPLSP